MNPDTCGASAELTGAINFNLGPKKGEIAQCAFKQYVIAQVVRVRADCRSGQGTQEDHDSVGL